MVHSDAARLPISLQRTDHPPAQPARVHLDLYTAEQAEHVDRLVGLGATRAEDWPYPEDPDFIVLKDPDGNEFCVIDTTAVPDVGPAAGGRPTE